MGMERNVRDWLYVEDHCEAIDLIIRKGRRRRFIILAVIMNVLILM